MDCAMPLCGVEATHVLLYGCINAHIQERRLCHPHMLLYKQVILRVHCEICGKPYEETLTCET